jgi:hypothetical protein
VLRTESPALALNIAEFLQPYIGAAWRLSRVILSIKTMGLPSFHSQALPTWYFDTAHLSGKRATFTVLEDTAVEIETPAIKRGKHTEPAGKSHGDSFRVKL